jgi:hypothetical protein
MVYDSCNNVELSKDRYEVYLMSANMRGLRKLRMEEWAILSDRSRIMTILPITMYLFTCIFSFAPYNSIDLDVEPPI